MKNLKSESLEKMLFTKFCNSIQAAYVSFSTMSYLQEQNRENWSDFEEELQTCSKAQESVKTFNLCFSPDILCKVGTFYFAKDCFISPLDITDELADNKLSLAGLYFLYCFARLECFGYELLKRKVPTTTKEEHNWHKCVYEKAVSNNFDEFKNIWEIDASEVNNAVLSTFAKIKETRNTFAHESHYDERKHFSDIQEIILIGYYLYYITTKDDEKFKIENYEENYEA